jgi:hypothetical protein
LLLLPIIYKTNLRLVLFPKTISSTQGNNFVAWPVWMDGQHKNKSKHMKKYPTKIRETRLLTAHAEHMAEDHARDGVDRRGFLKCMAWAGTGMLWTVSGGILSSKILNPVSALGAESSAGAARDFSFVQISDSHIGFSKPANPDVTATLQTAINKINAMPQKPDFIIHTGDLSQLSKPSEFDTLDQMLKTLRQSQVFYVPGEHDVTGDDGKLYLERFGKGAAGNGNTERLTENMGKSDSMQLAPAVIIEIRRAAKGISKIWT